MELIDAFNIFDPQSLPPNDEELQTYGQDRLEILLKTFGEGFNADVDCGESTSEWEGLKRLIHTQYSSLTLRQMLLNLLSTEETLRGMFPQLIKLSNIAALFQLVRQSMSRHFYK